MIDAWVKPAFKALVQADLRKLSVADVNQIGFTMYIILAKACKMINHCHKLLAAVPPEMTFFKSYLCQDHNRCKAHWRELWWKKLARKLLHPTEPLPLDEAISFLDGTNLDGIIAVCKEDMMEQMRGASGIRLAIEDEIIEAAVAAVIVYHKGLM